MNAAVKRLRKELSDKVAEEQQKFLALTKQFYDAPVRSEKQALKISEAIINAIDNVINAGDWEDSLFLKNTIKPLHRLKEEVIETRNTLLKQQGMLEIQPYQLASDEIKVYISLYQADGHSLEKWEAQLASINSYMAGRPIYKNERDIKKTIRQKLLQTSEAYAVAVIKQSQVMDLGFAEVKMDRYGHELVTLENGVVNASNIIEFVHSDNVYHYQNQRLIKKKVKDL